MSVSLELPCGCVITCCDVLSMCLEHAQELRAKEIEDRREHERFEKMIRDAQHHEQPTGEST